MSKEIVKNYGKSIRSKLLNIAKNEDVYYQTVLTRYFQERLIYRISLSGYRQNFYLKGGALMYAHEGFAARPTLDIDFLGNNISNDGERIVAAFREICSCPCEEDAVVFDVEHITSKNIPRASILAYSLETVVAEKLHAVVDLADQSSRMKDYYDLYQILKTRNLDSDVLQEAIARTFENRHTPYDPDTMFFRDNFGTNPQMETRWRAFIKKITSKSDLQFSEVVTYLQEKLLPYWKNLNY